ncbi:hypothetical protein V7146_02545 [Gottfriedia acidiceleris]|uniref:hypothetical protein n=1 Tax=Gottfriedia acidiceleris TaxID=371036 RepID=UPI002FFE0DE8
MSTFAVIQSAPWYKMSLFEVIQSIGSIATALAFIWAVIAFRTESKRYHKQQIEEKRKFELQRLNNSLEDVTNTNAKLGELILITQQILWIIFRLKDNILAANKEEFNILRFERYFVEIKEIFYKLPPSDQMKFGEFPIDPLIHNVYSKNIYKTNDELNGWVKAFEKQLQSVLAELLESIKGNSELIAKINRDIDEFRNSLKN